MRTILLGGGGTGTSFAIATRIRANWGNRVKIIVTDVFDSELVTSSIISDKFFKVPFANTSDFEDALIEIILKEKIDVYIPVLNDEIVVAWRLMSDPRFKDIDFWSSEVHASCIDKSYSQNWLRINGIPVPAIYSFENVLEEKGSYIIKPRSGSGGRGVSIMSWIELLNLPDEIKDGILVQEICEKPEVTVDSFFDCDANIGYSYARERLEVKAGVCTKARLFFDKELDAIAKKIGQALRQRGTICFQLMKNQSGWVVTDFNLRSGAGTAMTCAAGYDVLSAAYACRIGEDYSKFVSQMKINEVHFITRQYSEFVMTSHEVSCI